MKPSLSKMSFLISIENPHDPDKRYSKQSSNAILPIFYQDNSLEKSTNSRIKNQKKQTHTLKLKQDLESQSKLKLKAKVLREYQEKLDQIAEETENHHNNYQNLLNASALKIQKVFRGHLCQKKFDAFYIKKYEGKLKLLVQDLKKVSTFCFYNLGNFAIPVSTI